MTGREALNELHSLITGEGKVAEDITDYLSEADRERYHFLIDYIHGRLPATIIDEPGTLS